MSPQVPPPTVSVLLPTYRYARYLPQAIESVLSQTYTDFELIISDDASDDGSAEIIKSYAARDSRIRAHVQSPNLGIGHNWNWCLEQASGKYIKYLFGDDFLLSKNALLTLVELLELAPDISIAASARVVVDEQSRPIEIWNHIGCSGIFDGIETINWSLRANCNLIGEPSVVLFRRDSVTRPFDASFKQVLDWEFWIDLLQRGHLAYTTEPLCAFRVHPQQQSEINRKSAGSGSEHPRLMQQYARYFASTHTHASEAFLLLYKIRRKRIKHADDDAFVAVLPRALGSSYYLYWLRYKCTRLVANLHRTWQKHVRRIEKREKHMMRIPRPIRELESESKSRLATGLQGGGTSKVNHSQHRNDMRGEQWETD